MNCQSEPTTTPGMKGHMAQMKGVKNGKIEENSRGCVTVKDRRTSGRRRMRRRG